MKELKKAHKGMIAILTVMLVSIKRRLPTRKLSSGITTLALAGIVLLVAAGSASADQVYFVPEDSGASYCNTTTVEVYANTTTMIQGGSINLSYTSGCANVTDVEYDPMWDFVHSWNSGTDGYEWLCFTMTSTDGVNGTVHICDLTIHCECGAYCTTPLHFISEAENPTQYCMLSNTTGGEVSDVGWHNGTFTCMNNPNLVITEVYGIQTTGNNYTVNYTIKNMGNVAALAGHNTSLCINGTQIENKSVSVELAPNGSYTDTFVTELTLAGANDPMEVCADIDDDVAELNETDNCMEGIYPAGIEIKVVAPDGCVDFQEQFTVNIDVDPRNIQTYGIEYVLSFNNEVLHCEWQNEGTFLSGPDGADTTVLINTINNGAGTIAFAATRVDTPDGVIASGTVATIKFTAIQQDADTNLNLSGIVVSNNLGNEILPVDDINGSVCVSSNLPPVAIGKSMHKYNNDGQKYICKVYLNGTESYDPNGTLVNWKWSFGDGNYDTGELKDHVYQSWNWNGASYDPFTVILTVTDDGKPHQLDNTTSFDVIVYTAGDANGDGKVNILDATRVGLEWGKTTACGVHCWEGNETADRADLNNDCTVNILDAVIIGTCWGHTAW